MVSEWSVTRQPGLTTLTLQGCLEETKAPLLRGLGSRGLVKGRKRQEQGRWDKGWSKEYEGGVEEPWAQTGLRPSIMSPLVLGSVDFANCKHFGRGRGRARVSYRFSQDELAIPELVRPKRE